MSKPETAGWCPLMNVCDRGCEQGSSRTQMTRCVRAIEAAKLPSDPMAPIPEAKSETAAGQQWANVIRFGVDDREAERVIDAINEISARRKAKSGTVIIACAQVLAQSITQAPKDVAPEVRAGILALIDGYAMQSAIQENDDA